MRKASRSFFFFTFRQKPAKLYSSLYRFDNMPQFVALRQKHFHQKSIHNRSTRAHTGFNHTEFVLLLKLLSEFIKAAYWINLHEQWKKREEKCRNLVERDTPETN